MRRKQQLLFPFSSPVCDGLALLPGHVMCPDCSAQYLSRERRNPIFCFNCATELFDSVGEVPVAKTAVSMLGFLINERAAASSPEIKSAG